MKTYTLFAALLAALVLLPVLAGCSPLVSAGSPDDKTPVNLDGTSWTLIQLNGQDLLPGTEITLVVDGEQLSGTAGCNRYFGTLTTIADGTPSVGMVGSTEMWCGAPEGVMEQETGYLRALGSTTRATVENDELTLFDAAGQALLVFVPRTESSDEGNTVETSPEKTNVLVDEIDLLVMESFPVQVAAIVKGNLPNGCVVLDGLSAVRTDEGFVIEVKAHKEGDFCTEALVPFKERVALDVLGLKAGTYTVRVGEVSAEFTLDVDNGSVETTSPDGTSPDGTSPDGTSPDGTSPDGTSTEYIRDLRGTVTAVEIGADGVQVTMVVPLEQRAETVYSVTISALQAEVFGRWEEILPGAELVVSGPASAGMAPTLIVAEKVTVVGSGSDYVSNLHGTVTSVEPGPTGLRAEIRADDGTDYRVTFDPATTEIVYLGGETEIQAGTPVLVSGELFHLIETRLAADVAVVL